MIVFYRSQMGGRDLLDFLYLFIHFLQINFDIDNFNHPFIDLGHNSCH